MSAVGHVRFIVGDTLEALRSLPDDSVHCCVTSPPYWGLRDYDSDGQIGLEPTPAAYIYRLVAVFGEIRRVLRPDGTLWLNMGSVWTIPAEPFAEAHFATFPTALAERCIKAGCPDGGTVLDPLSGAGTTAMVADRLGRDAIGIELNPEYIAMAERRLARDRAMRGTASRADQAIAALLPTPLERLLAEVAPR